MKRFYLAVSLFLCFVPFANAKWQLDNTGSFLSFVSVKKGNIAEAHTFKQLAGNINKQGKATLQIELASVDTLIEIRNERMRNLLFETELFPKALFVADIDMAAVKALANGATKTLTLKGSLALHGNKKDITTEVSVSRLDDNSLLVSSRKPILLNAQDFALEKGVEKLREVALLPSISTAVPVSFTLLFKQG